MSDDTEGLPLWECHIEYGRDLRTDPEAWRNWQYKWGNEWTSCTSPLLFQDGIKYRRKPRTRTITINGHEVPEPVRHPLEDGESYWIPGIVEVSSVYRLTWSEYGHNKRLLRAGMIHRTREAAEAHAKALISFTQTTEHPNNESK